MSVPDELLQAAIESVKPSVSIHDVKIALPWRKQTPMQRAEAFLGFEDGLLIHSGDARFLAQDLKSALAEVERLREVVRKVHEMSHKALVTDWRVGLTKETLEEINNITKGMVE